ncbi:pyruvate dehydrogenase (acetyl-transferring), homodimeric type, partial [Vibrio sp. 10N.286.49.E1]
ALVADMTDDEIFALKRGGHDSSKLFAAFNNAKETNGKPTVILAKTVKGYGMGDAAEGKNIAHGVKKMDMTHVQHLRDRLGLEDIL